MGDRLEVQLLLASAHFIACLNLVLLALVMRTRI